MTRFSIAFVFVLLLSTTGNAQENDGVEISVSSGYVLPSSPMTFSNYWKMQYGGGAAAGLALSPSVTLVGSVEYYKFALKPDGIGSTFDTKYMRDIWAFKDVTMQPASDPSSVMSAAANLRVAPSKGSGIVSPYFTAGLGVMSLTLGEITVPITSTVATGGSDIAMTAQQTITGGTETSLLVQFGVGVDVRLNTLFTLFAEARYAHGVSKGVGTSYLPLTAGLRFRL